MKAIFYALRFDMIYDYRLQMSRQNFRTQNYFRQQLLTQFIDKNKQFFIFCIEKPPALLKNAGGKQNFI